MDSEQYKRRPEEIIGYQKLFDLELAGYKVVRVDDPMFEAIDIVGYACYNNVHNVLVSGIHKDHIDAEGHHGDVVKLIRL